MVFLKMADSLLAFRGKQNETLVFLETYSENAPNMGSIEGLPSIPAAHQSGAKAVFGSCEGWMGLKIKDPLSKRVKTGRATAFKPTRKEMLAGSGRESLDFRSPQIKSCSLVGSHKHLPLEVQKRETRPLWPPA